MIHNRRVEMKMHEYSPHGIEQIRNQLFRVGPVLGILFLLLSVSTPAFAQEEKKKDNSGTNPASFTYDFRLITEMIALPDDAGSLIKNTAEMRWPLGRDVANVMGKTEGHPLFDMGKMFSLRMRANYQNLSLNNLPAGQTTEFSGIGDLDARLLMIAYASKRVIIAPGVEAFFDTATNDALGNGNQLAPVIFAVFPGVLGGASLFAPGYQYVFNVGGDTVSRSQIDLYFVWLLAKGKNWLIVDPQIILDHENSKELGTVEAEWGFMIAPQQGISAYARPGFGVGTDRPYDWNLEFGLKFVWR
jgi:hypothetical protein